MSAPTATPPQYQRLEDHPSFRARFIRDPAPWDARFEAYDCWIAIEFENADELKLGLGLLRKNREVCLSPRQTLKNSLIIPYQVWSVSFEAMVQIACLSFSSIVELRYKFHIDDMTLERLGKPGKRPTQGWYRVKNAGSSRPTWVDSQDFIPSANIARIWDEMMRSTR